jgi:DNA gyrase inhibitor GyrI
MTKIKVNLLIIFAALSMQSCSAKSQAGYYKGYEIPSYKVTKQIGDIEIREYEPNLVAEVEVEGDRKKAANEGFMTLARYIFGKNISEKKVAMTSPVSQKEVAEKVAMTSPVNQISNGEKKWVIQFGMPKEYKLESLPRPKDSRIKFKITEPKRVIAIRFSGLWRDTKFDEKKDELSRFVKDQNIITKGVPTLAYYDDPFTFPWNRRNEIIWEIK